MMKKYFVIGNPIDHSLSPILHNYWFQKYKIDANYSPINLEESKIPDLIMKIRKKEIYGVNVTLPYKQKIINFLDEIVNDAKSTNSVNTIHLDTRGKLVGFSR